MIENKNIYTERVFTYSCLNPTQCIDLLEKIDEELSLEVELVAEFKHNKLVFRVIGLEPKVQSAINKIKEYIGLYMNTRRINPQNGIRSDELAKIIRKTIPIDVLSEVLRYTLGVSPRVQSSTLYVDLDLDTVIEYAKHVALIMERFSHDPYPHSLKKLLITSSVLFNVPINELIDLLKNKNIVSEELELKIPWQEALRILVEHFNECDKTL